MAIDLLVIFNHRYESVVDDVVDYNRRFSDNVVVAAPFATPGGVQYSSGVFYAQGAIVEYLAADRYRNEYTLVIHDDLVLNPTLEVAELLPEHGEAVRIYKTRLLEDAMNATWFWQLRVLTNWFTPRSNPFGTGVDSPRELLATSRLYAHNRELIEAMGTSRLTIGEDPKNISMILDAWIETNFPGCRDFTFGLPLFMGNADYLLFPNRHADLIEDFLRRTVECGLVSEVAVPTMANWLGLPLHFDRERQVLQTGVDWFTDVTSLADIDALFAAHPELISVHPIKFSRLRA